MAGAVSRLTSNPSGSGLQQEIIARLNLESLISWDTKTTVEKDKSPYCLRNEYVKTNRRKSGRTALSEIREIFWYGMACLGGGLYWPGPQHSQGTGRGGGAREANYHAPRGNERALHLRQDCRVERPPSKQVAF
jgi:hypothetical protein